MSALSVLQNLSPMEQAFVVAGFVISISLGLLLMILGVVRGYPIFPAELSPAAEVGRRPHTNFDEAVDAAAREIAPKFFADAPEELQEYFLPQRDELVAKAQGWARVGILHGLAMAQEIANAEEAFCKTKAVLRPGQRDFWFACAVTAMIIEHNISNITPATDEDGDAK